MKYKPLIDVKLNKEQFEKKDITITDDALNILNNFVESIYEYFIMYGAVLPLILSFKEFFDDDELYTPSMKLYTSHVYDKTQIILYGGIIENIFEYIWKDILCFLRNCNVNISNISFLIEVIKNRPKLNKICNKVFKD